jgi:hypothetical protein
MKTFRLAEPVPRREDGHGAAFAVIMLALVAGGAFWAQQQQTRLLQQVVNEDMAVSSRLLQASKRISAVHGSLYQLMTHRPPAGPDGQRDEAQEPDGRVNGIKAELTAIKARLPADQQAKFGGVLKDSGPTIAGDRGRRLDARHRFRLGRLLRRAVRGAVCEHDDGPGPDVHDVISASSERAKASAARAALYGKALMGVGPSHHRGRRGRRLRHGDGRPQGRGRHLRRHRKPGPGR